MLKHPGSLMALSLSVQILEHVSLLVLFPSSHSSYPSLVPFPQSPSSHSSTTISSWQAGLVASSTRHSTSYVCGISSSSYVQLCSKICVGSSDVYSSPLPQSIVILASTLFVVSHLKFPTASPSSSTMSTGQASDVRSSQSPALGDAEIGEQALFPTIHCAFPTKPSSYSHVPTSDDQNQETLVPLPQLMVIGVVAAVSFPVHV